MQSSKEQQREIKKSLPQRSMQGNRGKQQKMEIEEIEENNRDLVKKIRDNRESFMQRWAR